RVLSDKRLTRRPVGHETIGGIATTRYRVDETVPEGHAEGEIWLSRDGIPMRLEGRFTKPNGKQSTIRWELHHVRIGPQPAALFEPPAGFSHLPAEALAPLLVAPVRAVPKRGGQSAGRLATPLHRPVRHGAFPLPPHGSRDGAACSIRAGRRAAALIARCPRLTRAAASPRCRRQN